MPWSSASGRRWLTIRNSRYAVLQARNPARVLLDPGGRLPATAKLFADGVRRLVVTAAGAKTLLPPGVEAVELPNAGGQIAPEDILSALAERGLRRVLIEGGADTVSRFLAAGCLDRLHVVVAPIILGSGRTGITLPPIERADEALRVPMHVHRLDDEVLYDCDLSAQRANLDGSLGRAKTST